MLLTSRWEQRRCGREQGAAISAESEVAPGWMADPRFRTAASRLKHRTELDCLLAEETVRRDGAELSAKLHS